MNRTGRNAAIWVSQEDMRLLANLDGAHLADARRATGIPHANASRSGARLRRAGLVERDGTGRHAVTPDGRRHLDAGSIPQAPDGWETACSGSSSKQSASIRDAERKCSRQIAQRLEGRACLLSGDVAGSTEVIGELTRWAARLYREAGTPTTATDVMERVRAAVEP